MTEETNKCRICFEETRRRKISLESKIPDDDSLNYAQIYQNLSGLTPDKGPQVLCNVCANRLLNLYQFRKKIIECESVWDVEIKVEKDLEEVEVKTETDEYLFVATIMTPDEVIAEVARYECKSENGDTKSEIHLSKNGEDENPKNDDDFEKYFETEKAPKKWIKKQFYECRYCPETFPKQRLQYAHEKAEHKDKILPSWKKNQQIKVMCPHCGIFLQKHSLDGHLKSFHLESKKEQNLFICDLCGKQLSNRACIRNHIELMHLKRKFTLVCRYCPETFTSKSKHHYHEVYYHTQKFKHECEYCKKKFIGNAQLRRHLVSHTGEKKYKCEICGRALSSLAILKNHLATHSDARPFSCDICNATFKTDKTLRVHKTSHEEWKYECPVCQRKFLTNQQLRQHVTKNHPEYELPPPGTVMNKTWLRRMQEKMERIEKAVKVNV